VQLVAQGFRNKEIGEKLFISEQTVKNHLHNIFDKLGVSDRLELALYAIHHRLIDLESWTWADDANCHLPRC
jgi:DNA-binding NarL/FixJ family response regulator